MTNVGKTFKLGVLMDSIESITPYKDSTLAMLLAAQRKDWGASLEIHYFQQADLSVVQGAARAKSRVIRVHDNNDHWFDYLSEPEWRNLADFQVVLMRKDPPFDMEYIYSTYLLERAEEAGTLVVNRCQSLRDVNEKVYISWFPQCTAPTLISRNRELIKEFVAEHGEAVIKPLDGMGGASIFRLAVDEPNLNVILDTMVGNNQTQAMVQKFLPEISSGDKRILIIDGEPMPYALARIPSKGEFRGNLAAGGRGVGVPLSERDRWLCEQIKPTLKEKGLMFVGLDVIGDYVTEINVTSPTCIRELDKEFGLDIGGALMDAIAARFTDSRHSKEAE
ncbi:MAG: glutathione synthase [Pseudoalteromonas tetraodonis]